MEFGGFVGFVLLVCLSLFSCSTEGYRFFVGGRDGWVVSPSENYNHWAERNRFQVNDTLYFKYNKGSDSVLGVNKDDFFKCNTNNPIHKLDGGNSEFVFNQSGPYYFISGQNGNCAKGQKLSVIVMAVRHHKQPNPPPVLPPSAAPSPSTPTTPSPQLPPSQPPMASPPKGLAPVGPVGPMPPSPSPSPVVYNPPATSPAPWSSPVPSPSTGTSTPVPAPSTGTTTPVPAPATGTTTPVPAPVTTPVGPTPTPTPPSAEPPAPTPPGTVIAPPPPPGSDNSTAPRPSGNGGSRGVTAPSGVLVSWVVGLVSVALMSNLN